MTYVIPNQFRTRQDTVRLALLDENFSSVAQQINNIEVVLGLGAGSGVATTLQLGLVRPDGTSILVTSGVISVGNPLNSTNWTIKQSSTSLYFFYNSIAKMKLDSSGTITVVGDVIAFGTL
jgi:hypothetical protein